MELPEFFICFLLISNVLTSKQTDTQLVSTTKIKPPVERIFSRRKRFLLLPNYGAMKITIVLSKSIIVKFPKGLSLSIEVSTYYPAPTERADLLPKKFRQPTTPAPKPKPTPPNYIYIPGTLVKYQAKPATLRPLVQRIGDSAVHWVNTPSAHHKNSDPYKWQHYAKYGSNSYHHKYGWTPAKGTKYQNYEVKSSEKSAKWANATNLWNVNDHVYYNKEQSQKIPSHKKWQRRKYSTGRHPYDSHDATQKPEVDDIFKHEPANFPDLEPFKDWKHYHRHRERRDIFHRFEGIGSLLGIDMKSCILRSICDSKRFLLPPGYSMIQDIIRVLFSLPTLDGMVDEYSQAMRADFQTCDESFRKKCPISLLDWFLNPIKAGAL